MNQYFAQIFNFENISLKVETSEIALKAVTFIDNNSNNNLHNDTVPPILKDTLIQLKEFFEGKRKEFKLNLDPEGTNFQKKVWTSLCEIPYGSTRNYAQMAAQLGDPKVIRAAATANGKNPIAIIIPCHRVIGTNGSLTGYAGGLENKRMLLDLENKVANGVLTMF